MGVGATAAQGEQGGDEPLRIEALVRISAIVDRLSRTAVAEVEGQGVAREATKVHRRAQLRYSGSDTTIEIPLSTPAAMRRAFESAHKSRFGFIDRSKAIVIEAVSVEAVGGADRRADSPNAIDRAVHSRSRDTLLFAWGLARGECLCARGASCRRERR